MSASLGKRERERMKLEKAQAKAERRAIRQVEEAAPRADTPKRSEAELVADLGALQRALEAGEVSQEEFEERRDRLQAEFAELS